MGRVREGESSAAARPPVNPLRGFPSLRSVTGWLPAARSLPRGQAEVTADALGSGGWPKTCHLRFGLPSY